MPDQGQGPSRQQADASAPAAPPRWATPADRQAAARDAYRASVANGAALTGAALGKMFDRSPRWGTARIVEVRNDDIARTAAERQTNGSRLPIGNAANAPNASDGSHRPVRIGSSSNGSTTSRAEARPLPIGNNGSSGKTALAERQPLPIGNAGDRQPAARRDSDAHMPNGRNGNRGNHDRAPSRNSDPGAAAQPPATRDRSTSPPTVAPSDTTSERSTAAAATTPQGVTGGQEAPTSLIVVTVAAVATVAAVTTLTSYTHTHDLAVMAGWGWLAAVLPAAVDGLVVAGSTSLMVDRRIRGRRYPGHPLAWVAVALGLASSMAANIVAVDPTLIDMRIVRWVMAGYAPVALAISGHLLLRMLGERP